MFLEEEVYGMLNWGFGGVMVTQLAFLIGLWFYHRFEVRSFIYLLGYLALFTLAGSNLLISINTIDHSATMGSENASINIAMAGIFWAISVLFLLIGISRLVKRKANASG